MDTEIENEIIEKGLTAPRIVPQRIDDVIIDETYYIFPNTTVTVCLLTLENGFNVIGESACASPENFDEDIGRKVAKNDAKSKIWNLEGYLLKEILHNRKKDGYDVR